MAVNPATGVLYIGDLNNNLIRSAASGSYSISSPLSAGLSFDTSTGTISGTPTVAAADKVYTVNAYNASGKSSDAVIEITVNTGGAFGLALNPDRNYITTYTPLLSGVTDGNGIYANSTNKDLQQASVAYSDGLGRPLQMVAVKASPQGKDIVSPVVYDEFGREAQKYLPYAAQGAADGSYKSNAIGDQLSFYNPTGSTTLTQQANGIVNTSYPFAITNFEPSPKNRVLEQGAPGAAWQPVPGYSTGHTRKISYTTNNILPLAVIADTATTTITAIYTAMPNTNTGQPWNLVRGNANGEYYQAGQLHITVVCR